MDDVFAAMSVWAKEVFGHLVIVVMNVMSMMLIYWASGDDITAMMLGMMFIPVATWAYYIVWRGMPKMGQHGKKISKSQTVLVTLGMIVSFAVEAVLAGIEFILLLTRLNSTMPTWAPVVILSISIGAMLFHAAIFILYLMADPEHNSGLHKAFEFDTKRDHEEKTRKDLARKEIEQDALAAEQAMNLTGKLIESSLPIIAEEKAREMAYQTLRRLGLDNNPRLRHLIESELTAYREASQTAAMAAANSVIEANYHDAPPADSPAPARVYAADTEAANPTTPAPRRGPKK